MYDMKIVSANGDTTEPTDNGATNCIKLLVELKDVDVVDLYLEEVGARDIARPSEDIEEYKLWDDEHLCVTYTVNADAVVTMRLQDRASSFEDRR